MAIRPEIADALNKFTGFLEFKKTEVLDVLCKMPFSTVAIFSGNQAGKTSSVAKQYVMRVLGIHPLKRKNELARKIRCMSSSLPGSSDPDAEDNTQYIELKKRIPPEMILKDVNSKSTTMVVKRPLGLSSETTVFEFRSSKQEIQDLGKIQLSSVWHDEETPKAHREECKMRLLAERGDEIFSLTPINALSYTFDEIWQNATFIFRTKTVADKFGLKRVEHRSTGFDIGCIQMATDDNPTLDLKTIDLIFQNITDPDEYILRRYGVFKQISGRVHKTYDPAACYISFAKTFPNGVPYPWLHCRGIDYHESRTPWSIGWLSCSPTDEWFLWREFHPAIDGANAYNTYEICNGIIRQSEDYVYDVNLIDPLANKKQPNSLFSVVDDLNRYFNEIRQNEGRGTPAFWQAWDTKGTKGRDNISMRFKNAVRCGKPFNNITKKHGLVSYLPTLWICDTCPKFHKSIMNWRYGEYVTSSTKAVNDPKPDPQQRHSHDNMVLECLAKHQAVQFSHMFLKSKSNVKPYKPASITGR